MVESWISDYPEDFITNQKAGNKLIQLIQFFHEIRMDQKLKQDLENEKNGIEVTYTEDDDNHRLKVLLQSKINEMILKSQGNVFGDEISNDLANSGDLGVPQAFFTSKIEFLSIPPQELAKQMCLCEFKLFKKIKNTHLFTADQRMNNIDIQNYISYINRVSNWIATEIVTTGNLKLRSSVIKYFVTLAVAFHQCRNFNALMQILCALSMACISRLKRTWKLIPKKAAGQWKELEDLFAPQGNFSKYRQLIGKTQLPCVPYFALYMKDATFIDDGNENFLEKDVVNYEKISMKYNLIAELSRYQIVGYQFTENQAIQNFLCNLTTLDEKTLYKYSCQCEPRSVDL